MRVGLLVAGLVFLAMGCSREPGKVTITVPGLELATCSKATASGLGGGGFRLDCKEPGQKWTLYVVYDSVTAKDGTIKSLSFRREGVSITSEMLPAVYSSARGDIDCPSAKALNRTTGEPPIPQYGNGAPKPGTYTLAMAKPCGDVVLEIGGL